MPFDENTGLFVRTDWSNILPPAKAPEKEKIIASKSKAEKRGKGKKRELRRIPNLKKIQDDKEAKEKKAEVKMLTESELKEKKRLEQKQKRRRRESHIIRLQMWKQRRQQEKLDVRASTPIKDEEWTYNFTTNVMRNGVKEEYKSEGEVNVKMEELPVRLKSIAPRFQQGSKWGVSKTTEDKTGQDDLAKDSNNTFPPLLKKEVLEDIEEDEMRALEEEAREGLRIEDDNDYDYDTDFIDDSEEPYQGYRVGLARPKLVAIFDVARQLGATASGAN